jgi:hypothetical protein
MEHNHPFTLLAQCLQAHPQSPLLCLPASLYFS